jgi:hypothetical protein
MFTYYIADKLRQAGLGGQRQPVVDMVDDKLDAVVWVKMVVGVFPGQVFCEITRIF